MRELRRVRRTVGTAFATVAIAASLVTVGSAASASAAPGDPTDAEPDHQANATIAAGCYVPPTADVDVIKTVYRVGARREVSDRVMLAAFEAGWVESHMNNLACGHLDSVGVFQQRPSAGWCDTASQCRNVWYASTKFFERAEELEPGCGCTAGQLAQRVQVSAYPDRYAAARDTAKQLIARAANLVRTWPVLREGMRSVKVITMQLLLRERGYDLEGRGYFGPKTAEMVKRFKRSVGLPADGVMGPNAWEKLVFRLVEGMSGAKVRAAKVQLNRYGFDLNADKPNFRSPMGDAVERFKSSTGLRSDRVIGTTTWRYLLGKP